MCGCGGPAVVGTTSSVAVRRVLCALPGFAAPVGRCGLAPVLLPWLWPVGCLSGVPRGPALVRRASSGPVALGAAVSFPVAVVPFPNPGACAPALLAGCTGHAEAGREPVSLFLPPAPAEARALGALRVVPARGHAMGLSLVGPSGVSLALRALRWLACVDPVTDASGFPYRLSVDGGLGRCTVAVSFGRRHLPFGVAGRHARVSRCARVCALLAGSGGPAFRARFGVPHPVLWPFLVPSLSARPPSGWGRSVCGFFCFFPLLRPPCLRRFVFSGPGCLGPWRLVPPPPISGFFLFSFLLWCARCAVLRLCVLAPGACWCVLLWALCFGGACVRLRSVVRCPLPAPPAFVLLPVVLRVPGGAVLAASLSPVLPQVFAGCAPPPHRLWCPLLCFVVLGVIWRSSLWRVLGCARWCVGCLCQVGFLRRVVWRGVVPGSVVLFLSCFAVLRCCVLYWFRALGWFGVASVSVLCLCVAVPVCPCRCSPCGAHLPLRRWLVFCVVACCVRVFSVGPGCPLLSPGGSWWLLVSCVGGVLWFVPGCCAAPCRCALCRLALRCCALFCFVLLRLVLPRAVLCPGALSVILGVCALGALFCPVTPRCVCFPVVCCCLVLFAVAPCAVCALGCRAVRFLPSPPCSVMLCGLLSLGALLPRAGPLGAVLPRGAVASCPAPLLGLFPAFVWFVLLVKPLQHLLKCFFGFKIIHDPTHSRAARPCTLQCLTCFPPILTFLALYLCLASWRVLVPIARG